MIRDYSGNGKLESCRSKPTVAPNHVRGRVDSIRLIPHVGECVWLTLVLVTLFTSMLWAVLLKILDQHWPEIGALIGVALAFTGIGICSIYCVWGRANLVVRGIFLVGAIFAASTIATCATRETWTVSDLRAWASIVTAYMVYALTPLGIARYTGLTLIGHYGHSPRALRKWQFSLATLLSSTTMVAIILVLLLSLDLLGKYVLWRGSNLAFTFSWVTSISVAAFLWRPQQSGFECNAFVAFAIVAVVVSFAPFGIYSPWVYSFMVAPEFHKGDYVVGANAIQVMLTLGLHFAAMACLLRIVRLSGFYLDWKWIDIHGNVVPMKDESEVLSD